MAVNKNDLVDEVANRTGVTKKVAKIIIDALLETTIDALSIGREVEWPGLGKFVPKKTLVFIPESKD